MGLRARPRPTKPLIRRQEVHVDLEDERGHGRPVDLVGANNVLVGFGGAGRDVPASIAVLLRQEELADLGVPIVPGGSPGLIARLDGVIVKVEAASKPTSRPRDCIANQLPPSGRRQGRSDHGIQRSGMMPIPVTPSLSVTTSVDRRGPPSMPRRAGYPGPEQMARKMLRNVEKRGVHAARNGPSEHRKCWQRFELGIHNLNRWTVKCC